MIKKVIARLYIKEASIPAFKELVPAMVATTRKEKGCIFYSLFQDVLAPGEFVFYEEYADQAALEAHSNSAYLAAFRTATADMHAREKKIEII